MPEPDPASTATQDFWRCSRCGTPNPARSYISKCLGCGADRTAKVVSSASPASKSVLVEKTRTSLLGRVVLIATWAYAALILLVLLLIHWVGESWWGVTVLLFFPRWLFLGPVAILALLSGLLRQPWHWLKQGAIGLVIAGPLMGLALPVHRLWTPRVEGTHLRVMTYNRGTAELDGDQLVGMLEREHVDLISFQEGLTPSPALENYLSQGWHRDRDRYIASRFPIVHEFPPLDDESTTEDRHSSRVSRVKIRLPEGTEFVLVSVHLPTIRRGFERLRKHDVAGLRLHVDWWARELDRMVKAISESGDAPFIVAGDFNMPSDDSTMSTLKTAMRFAFDEAGIGYGYTRPAQYSWVRIDHILTSPEWAIASCWVGRDCGSDHLPLLAELVLPGVPAKAAGSN